MARSSRIASPIARYAASSTRPLSRSRFASGRPRVGRRRDALRSREALGMLLEALDAEELGADRIFAVPSERVQTFRSARRTDSLMRARL